MRLWRFISKGNLHHEEAPEDWERKKWDLPSKIVIWLVPIILGYSAFDGDGHHGFFLGNICGFWIAFWVYQWEKERQEEKQRYIEYLNMLGKGERNGNLS